VAIAIGIISFATFGPMQPIRDAEFTRATAKVVAQNPAAAQAMDKGRAFSETIGQYAAGPGMFLMICVLGIVSWLIGKLFSSTQTLQDAIGVAAWANMTRVVGSVVTGVQGLLMDPGKLTSAAAISIGPARLFDQDATNPVLFALLARCELWTLWTTVLLAIGLYATGKVSKDRAVIFGILIWVLGSLPAISAAYRTM
jgi:hypothetical protein